MFIKLVKSKNNFCYHMFCIIYINKITMNLIYYDKINVTYIEYIDTDIFNTDINILINV